EARPGHPNVVVEGVPAVRPDRVGALVAAAGLLALARVDRLEVVDVAVRLVEVPVAVVVVPIPDVELREGLRDLRIALAGRRLLRMPGSELVTDKDPGVRVRLGVR